MNMAVPNKLNKKISVSKLINIILIVILLLVVAFGWWYLKGRSPIDTVQTMSLTGAPKPKYLFTMYGPENKRLRGPYQTYVSDDRIYIADTYNNRVVVNDYNGKYLTSFGKKGNHVGAMISPTDIIEVDNELYVVDVDLGGVEVWDKNGKFKRILGNLKFTRPFSIEFFNNKFYVLDIGTMKVYIISRDGKVIKEFGKQGNKDGEFYFPYGIEVRDNQIYIADSNNNRIQVFDENGKHLKTIKGTDKEGRDGFSIPRGVAFDSKGNIYTAEMLSNMVGIIDSNGVRIGGFTYGEPETDNIQDQMSVPTSVFIDSNNRLYVTELGKTRVLVYQI